MSFAREMGQRLEARSDPKTRDWWDRYLKGAIPFRGVPMGGIRESVHVLWRERGLAARPRSERLAVVEALFAQRHSEDKIAAILILAELVMDDLRPSDVPFLARPFRRGHIEEWSTCDWYCVKVLGPFIERSPDPLAVGTRIAAWRRSSHLWTRRAAAVAFVTLAPRGDAAFPGMTKLVLEACAANVQHPARFSQTAAGWVLRELSKAAPEPVALFVREHGDRMSTEAKRMATAKLRGAKGRR